MLNAIEALNHKLAYAEQVTLTRDEFYDLEATLLEAEHETWAVKEEIKEMESTSKQLDMAHDIIESLTECINSDGSVSNQKVLAVRLKKALHCLENLKG